MLNTIPCSDSCRNKDIWRSISIIAFIGIALYFFMYKYPLQYPFIIKKNSHHSTPLILLYTRNHSHKTRDNICRGLRNGGHVVNFNNCPKKCKFSCRKQDLNQHSPDAVIFFGEDFYWSFGISDRSRTSFKQRWIFWSWEAPVHHHEYTKSRLTFNWTMTYRQDSDIVHSYGQYILRNLSHTVRDHQSVDAYLSSITNQSTFNTSREFHSRKSQILWFVSNCGAQRRRKVAEVLNNHFPIDQYGKCTRRFPKRSSEQMFLDYKFYLAFENANCRDYITEKAFYNALAHGSIPVVLGPDAENYRKILPPNSFIHVYQFTNLSQLADHLNLVSNNISLFSSYHQWRTDYRVITWKSNYYIDDRFCDLCMKLHDDQVSKSYANFSRWLNQCK